MHPDILKAVEAGKLSRAAGQTLDLLQPGTYVLHKSWGFGQVDAVNFLVSQMTINFKAKKGHTMQLQYAAESLAPINADHILAQKAADLAAVKARAKNDPVALIRTILTSFGGRATQDQIAHSLVPEVFSEAEFKRWFENAKKALKADGHFALPAKKGLPLELRDGPIAHAEEYVTAYQSARQLREQIKALEIIIKHLGEFSDPAGQLAPVLAAVNDTAAKSARQKAQVGDALTLLATRDELLEKLPALATENTLTLAGVLRDEANQLATLLSALPAAKTRRAVAALPAAFGEDWATRAIRVVLQSTDARTVAETAALLADKGEAERTRAELHRAVSEHSLSSAACIWLCGDRTGPYADLLNFQLIGAIVAAMERDAHNEKKDRKLHDLLLNDQELLVDLISDASAEDLRDLMRKLLMTTVFADLNKRSLLGRIVRVYPQLEGMITGGGAEEKQETLIVSWESLEKRKADFDELVNKRIPENIREISAAREHGDLRENFEFKAAKEMQRVLGRRRSETERDLSLARGTDFANPDTSAVAIGTIVTLREIPSGQTEVHTILGAWDGDVEKGILSYQSALAQALIGHRVGETVSLPAEHGDRAAEIVKIEAYRK